MIWAFAACSLRDCYCREVVWTEPLALRHWRERGHWYSSALWEWNEKSELFSQRAPCSAPFLCHLPAPLVALGGSCSKREAQAALERQRKAEKWDRMNIVWLSLPRGWGSVEWMRVMRNYCFKIKEIKWHSVLLTELRLPSDQIYTFEI